MTTTENSTVLSILASIALCTSPSVAQSLTMHHHPATATQGPTVTITVSAKPSSVARIFFSGGLQSGITLPGLGTIYLNPAAGLFPIATVPVGATGQATLRFPLPRVNLKVFGQAVVTDASRKVSLTGWSLLAEAAPVVQALISVVAIDYNVDNKTVRAVVKGKPGSTVTVYQNDLVNKKTVKIGTGTIDKNGDAQIDAANTDIHVGDGITVVVEKGGAKETFTTTVK